MAEPSLATQAAVDWMLRLSSGLASPKDHEACAAWRAASPAHETAWQAVAGLLEAPVARLRDADAQHPGSLGAARRVLDETAVPSLSRRRLLQGGLGLLLAGSGATAWLSREMPLRALVADLHTGTAERRDLALADGSHLHLNARSVVDVAFSATERRLRLHQGELVVQVAPDAERPFIVQTGEGTVRALGTRFLVKQEEGRTFVLVLEHSVRVETCGGDSRVIEAGGAAHFTADRLESRADRSLLARAAWVDGVLDIRNQSLGEVVELLRPWYRGFIRVAPEAAGIPVFGVFPLDNIPHALRALADSLPIRLHDYGNWLLVIEPAAGPV